jgi:DNA-binding IclR family transcriptional regulator
MTDRIVEGILDELERHPAGLSAAVIAEHLDRPAGSVRAAIAKAISAGWLERWPFWRTRIRAGAGVPRPYLEAIVRLRQMAWPHQQRIHQALGAPVTLHLLVRDSHTVIERFPWPERSDRQIARERLRYATPRPLRAGATAMALLARLPAHERVRALGTVETERLATRLAEILAAGFCLEPATSVPGGWVMSAAIVDPSGAPYAALCTFGMNEAIPMEQARTAAPILVDSSRAIERALVRRNQ